MTDKKPKSNTPEDPPDPGAIIEEATQAAQEATQAVEEPVEEVIEEHTPPASPVARSIDDLYLKVEGIEQMIKDTLTKPLPEPKEIITNDPPPAEPTPATPAAGASAQSSKPKRKRITLFRGSKPK